MALFQTGDFTLASGSKSKYKIECDALTPEDWDALALMAAEILPPFGGVLGVPRGGIPFAEALKRHVTDGCHTMLIAEDVVTTGGSMNKFLKNTPLGEKCNKVVGVCFIARGTCPPWVVPLFRKTDTTEALVDLTLNKFLS